MIGAFAGVQEYSRLYCEKVSQIYVDNHSGRETAFPLVVVPLDVLKCVIIVGGEVGGVEARSHTYLKQLGGYTVVDEGLSLR